jgi:DNA-binding protein H-NS
VSLDSVRAFLLGQIELPASRVKALRALNVVLLSLSIYTNADGEEVLWSGRGRPPKPIEEAIKGGAKKTIS